MVYELGSEQLSDVLSRPSSRPKNNIIGMELTVDSALTRLFQTCLQHE